MYNYRARLGLQDQKHRNSTNCITCPYIYHEALMVPQKRYHR